MNEYYSIVRLSIAVGSIAAARRCLALTTNYVRGREAFGGVLGDLQSVQMTLGRVRVQVFAQILC